MPTARDTSSAWLMQEYENVDPVTFQVVRSALVSAAREMGIAMMRTAYSPIFVDGMDFSCGILDAEGEMVSQGEFCPVHLNSMAYSAQWALIESGAHNLHPGDVLVHNDPYRGGTHLSDVTVMKPVFVDDVLVAIASNRAHQIDVGGMARAGFAGDATSIFQEGLRIPPVKWFREGEEDKGVSDLVLANVRQPTMQRGDFTAQLASCNTAEKRIIHLCGRYGTEVVQDCFRAVKDYSERQVRTALEDLPDGRWSFTDWMDHDGVGTDPIRISVEIEIENDSLLVDFSETGASVSGPVNATYGITASMVFTALAQVCPGDIPMNHGCFRAVRIIAPRGSLTNAQFPSPTMGGNTVTSMAINQAVLGAFAQVVPTRVSACSYNSHHFTGGGRSEDGSDDWLFYFFTDGGWGAMVDADGWDAIYQVNGNCNDYPAEIVETTLPLRYEAVRLRPDLAGPGRQRGGCGTERVLTFLADAEVNSICERDVFRPYGLFGGRAAGHNAILVRREDAWHDMTELAEAKCRLKFSNRQLRAGDTVNIVTTGGGGYGSPLERDPDAVLNDVHEELYSVEEAASIYGVVLTEDRLGMQQVDWTATAIERSARASDGSGDVDYGVPLPTGTPATQVRSGVLAEAKVTRLVEARPDSFCKSSCSKKGDPRVCPLWNTEAIEYWRAENLVEWLQTECPRAEAFSSEVRWEKRY